MTETLDVIPQLNALSERQASMESSQSVRTLQDLDTSNFESILPTDLVRVLWRRQTYPRRVRAEGGMQQSFALAHILARLTGQSWYLGSQG